MISSNIQYILNFCINVDYFKWSSNLENLLFLNQWKYINGNECDNFKIPLFWS